MGLPAAVSEPVCSGAAPAPGKRCAVSSGCCCLPCWRWVASSSDEAPSSPTSTGQGLWHEHAWRGRSPCNASVQHNMHRGLAGGSGGCARGVPHPPRALFRMPGRRAPAPARELRRSCCCSAGTAPAWSSSDPSAPPLLLLVLLLRVGLAGSSMADGMLTSLQSTPRSRTAPRIACAPAGPEGHAHLCSSQQQPRQ